MVSEIEILTPEKTIGPRDLGCYSTNPLRESEDHHTQITSPKIYMLIAACKQHSTFYTSTARDIIRHKEAYQIVWNRFDSSNLKIKFVL